MLLFFLGKTSTPNNSPTLYRTDETSYVVQGWRVYDESILTQLSIPEGDTVIEIPPPLLDYLRLDGMSTDDRNFVPPIVQVKDNGNYIVQGPEVHDPAVLSQLKQPLPEHETCIHLSRATVAQLVGG